MTPNIENNQGRKTEFAKRSIIRYMLDAQLHAGDKLPPQQTLKQQLGLSSATIVRAIQSLKDEGLVSVRDKVGVFVKAEQFDGQIGRNIALLTVGTASSPTYASLAQFLHLGLLRQGCRPMLFQRKPVSDKDHFSLADFPGLEHTVMQHKIEGVIDMSGLSGTLAALLAPYAIPVTYVGSPWPVPSGVVINLADLCRRSMDFLYGIGLRRPAAIIGAGTIREYIYPEFVDKIRQQALTIAPEDYYLEGKAITDGRLLAMRLLQMPETERPDGLIFLDELIGNDLLAGLVVGQGNHRNYRPQIVSVCERQQQVTLPEENIKYFERDLEELAELAIGKLLECLRTGKHEDGIEYYCYRELPQTSFFPVRPETRMHRSKGHLSH